MIHHVKRVLLGVAGLAMAIISLYVMTPVKTEAAINPQISFQGKITNPDGTNVTNNNYTVRFRLYTDPTLDSVAACGPTSCKWEETKVVNVVDGIFQTSLGDTTTLPGSIDFNTAGIYLGIKVGADLEMTPRIRFTASPYAFNADRINGLASSALAQLTTSNTFTGANTMQGNSVTQFQVQNSVSLNLLNVNASGLIVQIGSVTTDASAVELVLDSYNQAADPTGQNGAMYYNTVTSKFRCYEGAIWKNCITKELATRSFVDNTADPVIDANTTNYWDTAVENNNANPNITLSSTAKSVWAIATIETNSAGTGDLEVTARVERAIGAPPTCGSGTTLGRMGTFSTNTNVKKSSTTQFIDSPATTSQVFYTVCSDADTVLTTGTVNRIQLTLFEIDNTN